MRARTDALKLLHAPLDELVAEAARLRDAGHGDRMTFSPKVFIPLTMLCRDCCGYCPFAKPPARLQAPSSPSMRSWRSLGRGRKPVAERPSSRSVRPPRTSTP